MSKTQTIVLAGGCFWGMQDLIRTLPGVQSTRAGYAGGEVENATYDIVKGGASGHAESLEVVYLPDKLVLRDLLAAFFQIHDPSTVNRQGNDRGSQYRSAIFYTNDEQKRIALETIDDVNESGLWPAKAVTEVSLLGTFWQAEPEHQDYLQRFPSGYTCHFVRPDWKLPPR